MILIFLQSQEEITKYHIFLIEGTRKINGRRVCEKQKECICPQL